MLNFFVHNTMTGNDYSLSKCTCGYEKKHFSGAFFNKELYCPDCGIPMIRYDNPMGLSFNTMRQTENICHIKAIKNKKCAVEICLYTLSGSYHIDFENRDIVFEEYNEHTLQNAYKIVFDGTLKEEDMLKVYFMETNEEVTFQQAINSMGYNMYRVKTCFNNFVDLKSHINSIGNTYISKTNLSTLRSFFNKYKEVCKKNELLIKADVDPGYISEIFTNEDGTNPSDFLSIRPYMFKYLRENNRDNLIGVLRRIDELFGDQGVHYLNTFGKESSCMTVYFVESIHELISEANLSISKLYKYLYKDAPLQQGLYNPSQTLRILHDSFNLSKMLELPFDKNPKALERYHDILTREYNTIKDQIVNKAFCEKVEKYQYLNFQPENSDYAIVTPKDSQDLVTEGKKMKHCVGSYINRVADGKSIIVFLRRTEDIDTPYMTIEIDPIEKRLVQIKEKHNGKPQSQKATDFVKKWCKKNLIEWKEGCY